MTDRELLELAAKAAGYEVVRVYEDPARGLAISDGKKVVGWNPLTDDGDALRLAVKLGVMNSISIDHSTDEGWCDIIGSAREVRECFRIKECYDDDPYAATRRAIFRAAAEIGKSST